MAEDVEVAVAEIALQLGDHPCSAVLFFASSRHALQDVATCMAEAFPHAVTAGCSTVGEIGPQGMTTGGIVAMAFEASWRVAAVVIDLRSFLFQDGGRIVAELLTRVRGEPSGLSPDRHVFVTLTDGLSGKEELLVASLGTHAPGVPLVGGSAGDDYRFESTWVGLGGQAYTNAAVVMLLEPGVPFEPFHLHHFRPGERRLVVTAAEPARRLIRELDGWPAIDVLADILGIDAAELRRDPVRRTQDTHLAFAFRVGDRYYLRTVMTVMDGALLMGGAVEEGAVLRVMEGGDLVEDTRRGMHHALHGSGRDPAGLLLFNCGGRLREARARGLVSALHGAMCPPDVPSCGFTTYGEQYGPMQVNSTLTGLVFFHPATLHVAGDRGSRAPWLLGARSSTDRKDREGARAQGSWGQP